MTTDARFPLRAVYTSTFAFGDQSIPSAGPEPRTRRPRPLVPITASRPLEPKVYATMRASGESAAVP